MSRRLSDSFPRLTPVSQRTAPRRRRVVLADRRRPRTVSRNFAEIEEQNSVGEAMVRQLVRAQLRTSLLLAALTALVLGSLPLLFWAFPALAEATVFGARLPWLLLGMLPFPFLLLVAHLSKRSAERHEREFLHLVEN